MSDSIWKDLDIKELMQIIKENPDFSQAAKKFRSMRQIGDSGNKPSISMEEDQEPKRTRSTKAKASTPRSGGSRTSRTAATRTTPPPQPVPTPTSAPVPTPPPAPTPELSEPVSQQSRPYELPTDGKGGGTSVPTGTRAVPSMQSPEGRLPAIEINPEDMGEYMSEASRRTGSPRAIGAGWSRAIPALGGVAISPMAAAAAALGTLAVPNPYMAEDQDKPSRDQNPFPETYPAIEPDAGGIAPMYPGSTMGKSPMRRAMEKLTAEESAAFQHARDLGRRMHEEQLKRKAEEERIRRIQPGQPIQPMSREERIMRMTEEEANAAYIRWLKNQILEQMKAREEVNKLFPPNR